MKIVKIWESQDEAGEKVGLQVSTIPVGERSGACTVVDNVESAVFGECAEKSGTLELFRLDCPLDSPERATGENGSFQWF